MRQEVPITRDLLLIGGGHAHALLLRAWAMRPLAGARLTLVTPAPTAPYTGMLPGVVAGHYPPDALQIDLVRLARGAGARLILDRAAGLDRAARRVALAGRPPVAYDVVSLNIGIETAGRDLPGMAAHAAPVKPLDDFADAWERHLIRVSTGAAAPRAAVIGGGLGGAELAMAMAWRLRGIAGAQAQVALIERAATSTPEASPGLRRALAAALSEAGVDLRMGATAAAADAEGVALADGGHVGAAFIALAAGARAQGWLAGAGLALQEGFPRVDACLRSVDDPTVFVAGDAAHLDAEPRPKAGVFAVRQAPALAENLRRALRGAPLRPHHPQRDYLKLVSLGPKRAVAEKWGVALGGRRLGPALWRWKDRIDQAFMARLAAPIPQMAAPAPTEAAEGAAALLARAPLCGGCGSKAPAATLAALAAAPPPRRADVARRPGDDAAVVSVGDGALVVSVDHFRAFMLDPHRFAQIAALHAMSDVWAMGARPQAALAAVTLPAMSASKQRETLAEITAGLAAALGPAGADLAGGHTALGAELALGVTVTGVLARPAIGLDGGRAGDALILTKPLGVGALLAAEMRGLAPPRAYAAALRAMTRSNGRAAELLAPAARALTDVTGFGLAGHLAALASASETGAEIALEAIPFLDGAVETARAGIHSSIQPDNRAAHPIAAEAALQDDPRRALLHDPQTSGGLLAAVAPETAAELVETLRRAGETAALIGRLTAPPAPSAPRLRLVETSGPSPTQRPPS